MPKRDKEKKAAYDRDYALTPAGRKTKRIATWKHAGIIPENGDYDALYEWFIGTLNCEKCNVLLTEGARTTVTTRCCDHDHNIVGAPNVRGIICTSCNTRDRVVYSTNTSGHRHIGQEKRWGHWYFHMNRRGLKHYKGGFKTKEDAAAYKEVWMGENVESR